MQHNEDGKNTEFCVYLNVILLVYKRKEQRAGIIMRYQIGAR